MNTCCNWKLPFFAVAALVALTLALLASGCIFVKS